MRKKINQTGFSHVELIFVLVVLAALIGVGWHVYSTRNTNASKGAASSSTNSSSGSNTPAATSVNPNSSSSTAAIASTSTPALSAASHLSSGTTKADFSADLASIKANLNASQQDLSVSTQYTNGNL